jgi:alpha-ketoglutarate-dependent taurine dioxygenase
VQTYAHITVEPASRNCEAFVAGVDLTKPVTEAICREIHTALMRHQVVFIRDQDCAPSAPMRQLALGLLPQGTSDLCKACKGLPTLSRYRESRTGW